MKIKNIFDNIKLLKTKLTRKKSEKLTKSDIDNIFSAIGLDEKKYLNIKSFFNDDLIVISYKKLHIFIFYSTIINNYNIFSNIPERIYDKNINMSIVKSKLIEMVIKTTMEDINNNITINDSYLPKLIKTLNLVYSTLQYNKVISHNMKYKIDDSNNIIRAILTRNTSQNEELFNYNIINDEITYYSKSGKPIQFNEIFK